jgi:hypothetical protein
MSIKQKHEVTCRCGWTFEAELWDGVNAQEQPDLKELLLDGELNIVICPRCGEMFYAEHFVIYFDPSEELLAFVFPEARKREKEKCSMEMREKFDNIKLESNSYSMDYEPMILFGLESLMEFLVKQEENELEIQVVEKLAKEVGFGIARLRPSIARTYGIPKVLPCHTSQTNGSVDNIYAGLKDLTRKNRCLKFYSHALEKIREVGELQLQQETEPANDKS